MSHTSSSLTNQNKSGEQQLKPPPVELQVEEVEQQQQQKQVEIINSSREEEQTSTTVSSLLLLISTESENDKGDRLASRGLECSLSEKEETTRATTRGNHANDINNNCRDVKNSNEIIGEEEVAVHLKCK